MTTVRQTGAAALVAQAMGSGWLPPVSASMVSASKRATHALLISQRAALWSRDRLTVRA
jgi:hypothetical protein